MKRILPIVISVFLFSIQHLPAQKTELEIEIINYLPEYELLERARALMAKEIKEGNKSKVEKIRDYLVEKEDSTIRNFYIQESILLHFWLREFDPLRYLIHRGDNRPLASDQKVHWPTDNFIFDELVEVTAEERFEIKDALLLEESLNEEEKYFLLLALGYFIGSDYESQERLNKESERFLAHYPNSEYSAVIERNFRQIYRASNWAVDASFMAGYHFQRGELEGLFSNGFGMGFGGGLYFHQLMFQMSVTLGFTSPYNDLFLNQVVWERGHSSTILQFESSLGYVLFDEKRFSLLPFAGVGTTSISPNISTEEDETYYQGVRFKAKLTTYAGLGIRYKINKQEKINTELHSPEPLNYSFLKLQYRYSHPYLDQGYTGLGGEMHFISLSYSGFFRSVKRK